MKNTIKHTVSLLFITAVVVSGCQSSDTKVENAEAKVLEAKKDLADSKSDLYNIRLDTITNYEQFKISANESIAAQERNIAELKASISREKKEVKADYENQITKLEKKNNVLKRNLADFKDDGKDTWISFKNEFNHDMNELGKSLKDFTKNNVK